MARSVALGTLLTVAVVGMVASAASAATASPPRNVLYIVTDDNRPAWGAYGGQAITPNLDALAAKSLVFRQAFCQISVCAPSRMSFMSSRRPDTYGIWNFIDTTPADIISMPRHFRDNGYLALGLGKLWHQDAGAYNANNSWSDNLAYYPYEGGTCPHGGEGGGHCIKPIESIYDWQLMNTTVSYLRYAAANQRRTGQPFFIGTGYRKPHAPWEAPQEAWDLYANTTLDTAAHNVFSNNTDLIAWSHQLNVELANGTSFPFSPFSPVPTWVQQDQRRAYYASTSFFDSNVGHLLQALRDEGLENDTMVVVQADHGYLLGSYGYWEKKSNFEETVRVPLVMHVPWKPASQGKTTMALTELVDVFPTLAALSGLPAPPGVDGADLSALLDDPTAAGKEAAFHQYPACSDTEFNQTRGGCNNVARNEFDFMGYTMRTAQYRYTRWLRWNKTTLLAEWDGDYAEELYDHADDDGTTFGLYEWHNQAQANPGVAAQMATALRAFFDKPKGVETVRVL